MQKFKELFEASKDAFIYSNGQSPKNSPFKEDYIIVFDDNKKFHKAFDFSIGDEANMSDEQVLELNKIKNKASAMEFIEYAQEVLDTNIKVKNV